MSAATAARQVEAGPGDSLQLTNTPTAGGNSDLAYQQLRRFAVDLKVALEMERQRTKELEAAYYDTVLRLMAAASLRDPELGEHLKRMGAYVEVLALWLGLSGEQATALATAAPLHDIGKIGLPEALINKPGRLDLDEKAAMERHTLLGGALLEGSPSSLIRTAREIALYHHENWDGSGYPLGLAGEQIPLGARLVRLADTYDALRCERVYKTSYDHERALRIILEGDDRTLPWHFDPQLLDLLRQNHDQLATIWTRSRP